jgi:hypothetical protein
MGSRIHARTAQTLVVMGLLVCGWLGWRLLQLREETGKAARELSKVRDSAAVATLNNLALPTSRDLSVCNGAAEPVTITALTAVYGGKGGELEVFNSARHGWQTWTIPARREQPTQLKSADGSWPGRALFFAMDVEEPGGGERMLAGTADELTNSCISLFDGKP